MAKQPLKERRARQERLREHQEHQAGFEEEYRRTHGRGYQEGPHEVFDSKSMPGPPENKAATPDFASDEAAELWVEMGRPDLSGITPTGKNGYVVADIQKAG